MGWSGERGFARKGGQGKGREESTGHIFYFDMCGLEFFDKGGF